MRAFLSTLITGLLVLHGAIHLLGFLKWAKIADVPQLSGRTLIPLGGIGERAFALSWLAVLILLIGAASFRVLRQESWWAPALAGLLLSQLLIVQSWHDARYGTVLNLVLLVPVLAAAAHAQFSRSIDREIRAVLADSVAPAPARPIEASDLERLPVPVRRWVERSGVVGRTPIQTVRLRQRGELRTAPGAAWMPAAAEQYFTVNPPAFIWRVQTTMFGVLPVAGRDVLRRGHGEMLIKAASLLNVVRAGDAKIDHGSLLRFLGEMVWFPSAALEPYVSWTSVDRSSARVALTQGGLTVSAVFEFDDQGRVTGLSAERYLGAGANAKLTPWVVSCTDFGRYGGIEVPVRGEVRWNLPEGPFAYYRWEMLEVEFDRPKLYAEDDGVRSLPRLQVASEHRAPS